MASSDGSVKIDILGDVKDFSNKINSLADTAKNVLKGIAVAKITQEFVELGKAALDAYASYEQLSGGVETLFKDSADTVQKYADNAYKTSGLSANQYMETATGFAASLLQGLGGDTEEAAKMADLAITDMSDNANKMGTSMSSIQYAYQGFAKQNYTMLDNLKLGYGGTQAEMARLINDSGVLGDTMTVTAKTVNSVSFDKVIEAIHIVQERMGITGTTAKEAASTIEGSVNSAKAAWENLVAGLGNENANLDQLVTNLINSVETAAGNIVPRIGVILGGIKEAVSSFASTLWEDLDAAISNSDFGESWNSIKDAATEAFNKISESVGNLTEALSPITDKIAEIKGKFDEYVESGQLLSDATSAITTAIDGLSTGISTVVDGLTNFVSWLTSGSDSATLCESAVAGLAAAFAAFKISAAISGVLSAASTALSGFSAAAAIAQVKTAALNAVMNANPFVLVATLIAGVTAALITLYNTNETFRNAVNSAWESVKETISNAVSAIQTFFTETLPGAIQSLIDWFKKIPEKVKEFFGNVVNAIKEKIDSIKNAFEAFKGNLKTVWDNIVSNLSGAVDKIKEFFSVTIPNEINKLKDGFLELPEKFKEVGRNIIDGIKNGINEKISSAIDAAKNAGLAILNGAKSFLGIHSPSTVFRDVIGKMIVLGIGEGIKKEMPSLNTKLKRYMLGLVDSANSATKSLAENTADIFTKATTDKFKELEKVYEEATENAKKSAQKQFDLFDDLAEKSKKSTSKAKESSTNLIQSFQAQEQYWNKLADNIDNLTSRNIEGLDKLVEAMNDGSQKGSESIAQLAAKSDEELSEIVNHYNDLEAAQERWAISSTEAKKSTDELYAALEKLGVSTKVLSASVKEGSVNQELYNIYAEAAVEKLNELDKAYQDAAASALSSAQNQFELWDDLSKKSEESTVDLVKSLKAQEDYWNTLSDNVEDLTKRNIKGLTDMVNAMNDGSQKGAQYIAQLARKSNPELKELVQQYEQTKNAQENWANASAESLTSYQSKVDETIDAFQQSVQKMNMEDQATQAGAMTMQGFINGLNSQAPSVNSTISTIASAAWGVFQNVLRMHSPSKLFEQGGKWTMEGYGIGVDEESKNVNKTMENAAKTAATAFNDNNNVDVPDISKLAITDDLQSLVREANEAVAAEVGSFAGKVSLASDARRSANTEPQTVTNDNGIVVNLNYYGTGEPTDIKRISRQIGIEAAKEMRSRGVLA